MQAYTCIQKCVHMCSEVKGEDEVVVFVYVCVTGKQNVVDCLCKILNFWYLHDDLVGHVKRFSGPHPGPRATFCKGLL